METRTEDSVSWLVDVPPNEMRRIVDALYRTHHLISVITDLDTLLERITEESKQVASAEASSLMLYDEPQDDLFFHVALGEHGDQQTLKQQVRLKRGEGIAGTCAETRESIIVTDAAEDPRVFRQADSVAQFETRSILAVPMVDHDKLVGVLEVLNKVGGNSFTDVDRRILEVFSSLAATVIANARLIEANVRSERMAAMGQTVAGLSHYTKNVLSGITTSVEIIDSGLEQRDLSMVRKGWNVLKRSVDRISNVVQDMLTYSKPRVPMREPCDLAELIDDVRESCEPARAQKGATWDLDTSAVASTVQLDVQGVYRALLNLVGNAIDAVPDTLGRIEARAWVDEMDRVHIEVADNGPGVPEEARETIFDPFYSTKGSRGTGLGLAATDKIVAEHGGRIIVDRSALGGARFEMILPQHDHNGEETR